jgi:hypothetical protein
MAQLTVRLPDDFYKQVQRIVNDHLEMDLSTFVRDLFVDTIILWAGDDLTLAEKALAAVGQKHNLMGPPRLLLIMADHWREQEEMRRQLEEKPTEFEEKMWTMAPEELKNALREKGMPEEMIEALVGKMPMSLKEMGESLANDPELARIRNLPEEEREKILTERAWDRMIKTRRERRRVAVPAERKPKVEKA